MPTEKAVMFVDNSNIFKGTASFARYLRRNGILRDNQFLKIRWDNLVKMLESQADGLDIFARHFFASLPPASDVSKLRHRPSQREWEQLVKESAQTGFYRLIQDPPLNFTLHAVPLKFAEVKCGVQMRRAYFRCLNASNGELECDLSLDKNQCYNCHKKFLYKWEKGVDVSLAAELVIFCGMNSSSIDRVILLAGDGDYKEAIRYLRRGLGKDIQIVSWGSALSKELVRISNKPKIILEENWRQICRVERKPPLEESPAADEEISEEA